MPFGGFDSVEDNELFDVLASIIKKRVPDFEIRFKNESWWQRFIGKLAFFNKKYMTNYTSTFGSTVWFPTREFVEEKKMRAFKILAHEYVHVLDDDEHSILFQIGYAAPQLLGMLSFLSLLAIPFSLWWLLALVAVVFFSPIPAFFRAEFEKRGYSMNIAINIWRHGSVHKDTRAWLEEIFSGWEYYRMWPFKDDVRQWIDATEKEVYAIDSVEADKTILGLSVAFRDVYQLVTGIDMEQEDFDDS